MYSSIIWLAKAKYYAMHFAALFFFKKKPPVKPKKPVSVDRQNRKSNIFHWVLSARHLCHRNIMMTFNYVYRLVFGPFSSNYTQLECFCENPWGFSRHSDFFWVYQWVCCVFFRVSWSQLVFSVRDGGFWSFLPFYLSVLKNCLSYSIPWVYFSLIFLRNGQKNKPDYTQ